MFIQAITGTVTDVDELHRLDDQWQTELRPGATGFQGATIGVTDDQRFVALVRFDSPESARRNSERPEQGEWWRAMEKATAGVTVHDCSRVETIVGGGSDDAAFVQVMLGRVKDRGKVDKVLGRRADIERMLRETRPDVLGEVIAFHDDGDGFTQAVYFSSEAEARANEQQPLSALAQELTAELEASREVTDYLDLRQLTLH